MSIKRFVSALLTGALCLGVLTACGSAQKPASSGVSADAQRYSTIFYDAFDTVTQVIAYCDSEEEFSRQMDALHADLLEYHRLYDIYNDYEGIHNLKTVNDQAGIAPVTVDARILDLLLLCRDLYADSGITPQTISAYTVDRLHPNAAGMQRMSNIVAEALRNGQTGKNAA